MLRKIIIFAILIISSQIFFSCVNNEVDVLKIKIKVLENENIQMKNTLNKEHKKIINSQLLLLPQTEVLKLNEPNKITAIISQIQEFPRFKVYLADENYNYKTTDEIKFENLNKNRFDFHYTPQTKKENSIRVVSVFYLDNSKVELLGKINFKVK